MAYLRKVDELAVEAIAVGWSEFPRPTWDLSGAYRTFAAVAFTAPHHTVEQQVAMCIVGTLVADSWASLPFGSNGFACRYAAVADFRRLKDLCGKAMPNCPNAVDLGAIWPEGEPPWFGAAKAICHELAEGLAEGPPGGVIEPSADLSARLDGRDSLDGMLLEGKLQRYAGSYVVSDGVTIFAYGRNLSKARPAAEKKAMRKGVPAERLIDYFVPENG